MKIVIVGGTGLIGLKLSLILSEMKHEVVLASPSTGVNTVTNKGLDDALENAQIVVDVSHPATLNEQAALEFFIPSNKNLLAAERKAGVQHHIALSVVGIHNLGQSGYFRGKIAQEELIKSSGVPYTLVYSTQFHEFLERYIKIILSHGQLTVPPILVQPIASQEAASFLAEAILQSQVNTTLEIAGPQRLTMEQWVRMHYGKSATVPRITIDEKAKFLGADIAPGMLLPLSKAKIGHINYMEWLGDKNRE